MNLFKRKKYLFFLTSRETKELYELVADKMLKYTQKKYNTSQEVVLTILQTEIQLQKKLKKRRYFYINDERYKRVKVPGNDQTIYNWDPEE